MYRGRAGSGETSWSILSAASAMLKSAMLKLSGSICFPARIFDAITHSMFISNLLENSPMSAQRPDFFAGCSQATQDLADEVGIFSR
ncbi:hypothetical protein SY26_18775 [Paracoccus sp. 228]|nr:hypothetical protein SY26_18775 [Paracoccus sp. 228]